MYLRNTHFSISHSFLDIPLISRYLTHFSISHSFLDIFYIKGFVKSWTRSNRGGYARVDCGVEAIVGSQKSTRQGSQKVHVNGLIRHIKGLKKSWTTLNDLCPRHPPSIVGSFQKSVQSSNKREHPK